MKPDPKEKHKQHTFDAYCKRILKNERSDYHRRLSVQNEHEIPLSMLPQETLAQLAVWDEYFKDTYHFEARGFEIFIADALLAEALKSLPKEKLEVVLLYYFLGMNDPEIAAHLNLLRRTVSYRRTSSLQELKKFMEGNADE